MRNFVIAFLMLTSMSAMATPIGDWIGAIELPQFELKITVKVTEVDGNLVATISIPQQGAKNMPLKGVRGDDEKFYFELVAGPGTAEFDGKFTSPGKIEGNFKQGAAIGSFSLNRASEDDLIAEATYGEGIAIDVATGKLHGSLVIPAVSSMPPVALIIAGSGPTDRDGNTPVFGAINNSLKMLAMALEANGIASLRYDKRGVGESAAVLVDQTTLRIEDYMRDASAWIEYLMNDERLGDVFVIGHSEGALIGMVAAQAKPVTGYISIAGVGRSADKLLGDQLTKNIPVRELATKATEIIGQLAKGKLVSDIPPDLVAALDSSIQPYLISWFKYEPSVEIGKLGIPILIVQGTTDLQVSEADANTLHSAAKQSGIVIVPGMNHVLKPAEGDLMAQVQVYSDPDLPLHKDLAQPIVEFIKAD